MRGSQRMERCVLWICAVDDFPTIDTSHTRAAQLSHTANLRRRIFIAHLTGTAKLIELSSTFNRIKKIPNN
ncbi:hypothetical protein SFRURICE_019546 [Spodoptera frugiperda]|nr:hypothetical protein SFRURICE_019546 [Spodoptera frugiperda]